MPLGWGRTSQEWRVKQGWAEMDNGSEGFDVDQAGNWADAVQVRQ